MLTSTDYLDVTLHIDKNKIIKFALNYRGLIGNKWFEIYRVDNHHGFLHEQRFWRSPDPVPLEDTGKPINDTVDEYSEKIVMNFQKYRIYFIKSMGSEKYENFKK